MFIEITRKPTGQSMFINIDHIISISPIPGGGSQIIVRDNNISILTYESINDIKKLIKKMIKAVSGDTA